MTTYRYQYQEHPHNHGTPEPHTITREQLLARLTVWRGHPDGLASDLLHQLENGRPHGQWYRLAPFESYRVDIDHQEPTIPRDVACVSTAEEQFIDDHIGQSVDDLMDPW